VATFIVCCTYDIYCDQWEIRKGQPLKMRWLGYSGNVVKAVCPDECIRMDMAHRQTWMMDHMKDLTPHDNFFLLNEQLEFLRFHMNWDGGPLNGIDIRQESITHGFSPERVKGIQSEWDNRIRLSV